MSTNKQFKILSRRKSCWEDNANVLKHTINGVSCFTTLQNPNDAVCKSIVFEYGNECRMCVCKNKTELDLQTFQLTFFKEHMDWENKAIFGTFFYFPINFPRIKFRIPIFVLEISDQILCRFLALPTELAIQLNSHIRQQQHCPWLVSFLIHSDV